MTYRFMSAHDALQQTALPLTATAFASLMKPFSALLRADAPLALALSGGPDSTALALCLLRWCAQDSQRPPLVGLLVDHRLRPESADEAQSVATRLQALGLPTEVLVWEHPEIHARLHVAARAARYAFMAKACARLGATTLALAHQAEDQAETVLERFAKGSGTDGLAGMAPQAPCESDPRLTLIRPLLSVSKASLVATCAAAAVPFVSDPSNTKEKYARGRLRRLMPLLEAEGFSLARLVDLAARAREDKEALHAVATQFAATHLHEQSGGALSLDREAFAALPRAMARRVLDAALRRLAPRAFPLRRTQMDACLEKLCNENRCPAYSLGGVLMSARTQSILLLREMAAIRDSQPAKSGAALAWDNNWQVFVDPSLAEKNWELRKLGLQPAALLDRLDPLFRKKIPMGRLRAALPALWEGETLKALPQLTAWHTARFTA